MKSISFAIRWDSRRKSERERSGFHPGTAETNPGLVLGRLSFWVEFWSGEA